MRLRVKQRPGHVKLGGPEDDTETGYNLGGDISDRLARKSSLKSDCYAVLQLELRGEGTGKLRWGEQIQERKQFAPDHGHLTSRQSGRDRGDETNENALN